LPSITRQSSLPVGDVVGNWVGVLEDITVEGDGVAALHACSSRRRLRRSFSISKEVVVLHPSLVFCMG